MAQVKLDTLQLVIGHAKKSVWSFLIIYQITQKHSRKAVLFVE